MKVGMTNIQCNYIDVKKTSMQVNFAYIASGRNMYKIKYAGMALLILQMMGEKQNVRDQIVSRGRMLLLFNLSQLLLPKMCLERLALVKPSRHI